MDPEKGRPVYKGRASREDKKEAANEMTSVQLRAHYGIGQTESVEQKEGLIPIEQTALPWLIPPHSSQFSHHIPGKLPSVFTYGSLTAYFWK